MAIREGEDRTLGSRPEKLLTLEEAARRLNLPADTIEGWVRSGKLTAFRLGGSLLRVRLQDVELLQSQRDDDPSPFSSPLRGERRGEGIPVRPSLFFWERLTEFLHFNDFYLVSLLVILTLLAILFAL